MITLKKSECANLICMFRMFGSILVLATVWVLDDKHHFGVAVFYAILFISDLFDGYCYRKYAESDPPSHWFNNLPVSMDPLADLVFALCGIAYVCLRADESVEFTLICCSLVLILAALLPNIILRMLRPGRKARAVVATLLTYEFFAIMMIAMIAVWAVNTEYSLLCATVTLVVFYVIFLKIVPKNRYIRR